jgi:hypothetical protein
MEGPGAAIVRFRFGPMNDIVGHGVLVDDEHVVTCAHVINATLGRPLDSASSALGELVRLEFPLIAELSAVPPERRARVVAWTPPGTSFDGIDVAGLVLTGESRPAGANPAPVANQPRSTGDVLLFGPVRDRPGGWVPARLRPLVKQHRQQIDQQAHGAFIARPGFSGTPVVDEQAGHVLGLLVATAVGRTDSDVYAIPLPSLIAAWPEVFASLPPSPYKGLEAFGQEDAALFFGRRAVADELERVVNARGLVPLVGASGVGKSSVVHAGLLPRLACQETRWAFVTIRPRPNLFTALAAGLARGSGSPLPVPQAELEAVEKRLRRDGLADLGNMVLASTGTDRLLLVVDQFEEVAQDNSDDCSRLLTEFAQFADENRSPLVAVLTLREDSFGTFFVRHADFGERLRRSAVALRGMGVDELGQVIHAPAALRAVVIQKKLVDELIRNVHKQPGALPLLEFALDRMWRTLRRGQDVISFDAYEEIGRLDGALAEYADGVLRTLSDAERATVRRLFLTYVTSAERHDIRRVAKRAEIPPGDWPVVVRLANERLLTIGRDDNNDETVEVIHEALLRAWGTLHTWLDAEQPFRMWRNLLGYAMAQPAAEGEQGAALLTGSLLIASEMWLAERPTELTLEERRFVEASRARADEDENRYRMLYRSSLSRTLTSAAEAASDGQLALLLAIEALDRAADSVTDRLVRACLRRLGRDEVESVPAERYMADFTHARNRLTLSDWTGGPGLTKQWSIGMHDASLVIDERGRARAISSLSGARIPMSGPVVAAACAPDVGIICLATEAGNLSVWQTGSKIKMIGQRVLGAPVMCVAVSSAANVLAVACDDGMIRVLLPNGDLEEVERVTCPGFVEDVDVSTDGRVMAALARDGRIMVWDLLKQKLQCDAKISEGFQRRLAFAAPRDHLLVGPAEPVDRIPVSPAALASRARQIAGRRLTSEEWRRWVGVDSDQS